MSRVRGVDREHQSMGVGTVTGQGCRSGASERGSGHCHRSGVSGASECGSGHCHRQSGVSIGSIRAWEWALSQVRGVGSIRAWEWALTVCAWCVQGYYGRHKTEHANIVHG